MRFGFTFTYRKKQKGAKPERVIFADMMMAEHRHAELKAEGYTVSRNIEQCIY